MLDRPYRRIIRPFPTDSSLGIHGRFPYAPRGSKGSYLDDADYAPDRIELLRSYYTLERDFVRLLEFVEPTDSNLTVFSIRMYELLLRACTEVETNCKAILAANGYEKGSNWGVSDYMKINASSRLSDYELRVFVWRKPERVFRPFAAWSTGESTPWYRAYNDVKHDRHRRFEKANLENTVNAISAVLAILFSQFHVNSFRAQDSTVTYACNEQWLWHEDSVFALRPPQTWTDGDRYSFNWSDLKGLPDRFEKFKY